MFHILNKIFHIFRFICISVEFIAQKLTKLVFVDCSSQLIRSLFTRYDKFELVCMTKDNSIKMFYLLFLSDLETIDKNFGLRLRNNEKLFFFLKNWTMSLINTKCVYLDIILLHLICTYVCFTLLQFINQ